MQNFRDREPREAFGLLGVLLTRSLLLRDSPAAQKLSDFLDAVNRGDMLLCSKAYHSLVGVLLESGARRVSGDLWRDYLLHTLLCTPHIFARQSAQGNVDEAVCALMETELSILGALSTLEDATLVAMAQGRMRELKLKSRQAKDNIELYSTAVWSGGSARSLPTQEEQRQPFPSAEMDFSSWRYGESGLRESYVADEALEELYLRLLDDPMWNTQLETLRCFFSAYGCGAFLSSRAFRFSQGALIPLPQEALSPLPTPVCFPEERDAIMDQVIRFMQGEAPSHILLRGEAGMGKTAQILSVAYELPEVRLIVADENADLFSLFSMLGAQPLKFLLFFDGVKPSSLDLRAMSTLPGNVLICFGTDADERLEWARRIDLPSLKAESFTSFVEDILEEKMIICPSPQVYQACVDHQVDARDKLSIVGALRLAESLRGTSL